MNRYPDRNHEILLTPEQIIKNIEVNINYPFSTVTKVEFHYNRALMSIMHCKSRQLFKMRHRETQMRALSTLVD